jgi:hypothetical protein
MDKNDYIIKRRMIQSIEFITDGFVTAAVDVSDDDVSAYYDANREDYFISPFVTFTHVFFDGERHSRDEAFGLAKAKLAELNQQQVPFSDAPRHGDRFHYFVNYVERDPQFVASHFGVPMAEQVFVLDPDNATWHGPYESEYGMHLVLLTRKVAGRYPELAEIEAAVRDDTEREAIAAQTLALFVLLLASAAQAHDARPNYVQITETETNTFSVSWKVPASMPGGALPYPTLPEDCVADRQPAWQQAGAEYVGQQVFRCEQGLSGRVVGIEFPIINPSLSTLYKIRLGNGEEHLRILKPSETEWTVPDAEDQFAVATQYTALGVEHIWIGIDHLLFVACLVFIAGTSRRLLITITGFTVAHSITLALSTLDLVRIPTPPVEAAIALSVVFMAWEIARGNENSLTHRYPIAVSASFGLLHGFGFAAVLRDIGLPQTELPVALLFFNVGVEIGQILFVLLLLVGFFMLRAAYLRISQAAEAAELHWSALTTPASFVIGSVASYWMITRVAGFWA